MREVPAHHATEGGVDKEMGSVRIKDQVAFPQPSGVGWRSQAEEFGEVICLKNAAAVIIELEE